MFNSIPEPTNNLVTQEIPSKVAESPESVELETQPYKISFTKYLNNECEINGMTKENSVCALKTIKTLGMNFTDQSNFSKSLPSHSLLRHVKDTGDYSVLYKGLSADEVIWEIKSVHESKKYDLRIFFYTIDPQRVLYLRAIRQSHYDTTK